MTAWSTLEGACSRFDQMVEAALDTIAPSLRDRMDADNLMIVVQPDAHDADLDVRTLGYFQGESESTFSAYEYPKRIVLLQRHIEHWCSSRAELADQVTDTVLHEVAHYFGMDHHDIGQSRLRH